MVFIIPFFGGKVIEFYQTYFSLNYAYTGQDQQD